MPKFMTTMCFLFLLLVFPAQAQTLITAQNSESSQEKGIIQPTLNAFTAYTKWRDETLRDYGLGTLTPHYAVAIVAQRLDDSTAQVEVLIAAEMKHYTVTIRPVTLNRLLSGETESKAAGNAVTIDQKAGDKLGTGADKIHIGQTTTTVPISKVVQALEISWTPKNDTKDDFTNTCIVQLGKEPTVTVNGYVLGTPIK
ncbi:MAG: hypothetical protein JST85_00865 [Acidobacteria bacterium]|nr:hypothetical protein [Acidobacteriota bacterium]